MALRGIVINSWILPGAGDIGTTIKPIVTVKNNAVIAALITVSVSGTHSMTGYPLVSTVEATIPAGSSRDVECPLGISGSADIGSYVLTPVLYATSEYPRGDPSAIGAGKITRVTRPPLGPDVHPTRGVVIGRISRVGDIGEPGYSVYGQSLPKCTYSGSRDSWHGATQLSLPDLLPTCYITESVYTFLTKAEIESVRSKIRGIVPDSYAHRYGECPAWGKCYRCWDFKPEVMARALPYPDPCEGIDCEPICDGRDRYETVCKEGDCVRGALLEANSIKCGYVKPECTEGDKKPGYVCSGGKWVPVGTPPPAPECTEGDKKPGYVCSGGKWVPVGTTPPAPECTEGDKKPGYVCSGGKWVPVGIPPDVAPEYLTAAEATERFRIGLPCYIKCVLPILDMLPGIPYTPGAWVPPFCAITTEP